MNTVRPDIKEIKNGEIVVWKNGLQQLELFDSFKSIIFSVIEANWEKETAEQIAKFGLNYIHKVLKIPDLYKLNKLLLQEFSSQTNNFFQKLVPVVTTNENEVNQVFIAKDSWIRIMTPEQYKTNYHELIKGEYGHLVVHNPHKDSWFSQAMNTINCWIAIGPVKRGNSVLIYPHPIDSEFEMDGLGISRNQLLNPPMAYDLLPGDILFFNGDYMHSSELNFTEETRFVVSFRVLFGEPEYYHNNFRYTYTKWKN